MLLLCGMKIHKLDHCSIKLSDYKLTFVHIKGTDNILADAISKLKMLKIYTKLLENTNTEDLNNTEKFIAEVIANKVQTLSTDRLHSEQKKDTNCRKLAAYSHQTNRTSFNLAMIFTDGLLQKQ